MSRSKKDKVGGHDPHGPGFEWHGRRSCHWDEPGRDAKRRASSVHRMRDKAFRAELQDADRAEGER